MSVYNVPSRRFLPKFFLGGLLAFACLSPAQAANPGQLLLPQGSILETETVLLNLDRYKITGEAPYAKESSLRLSTQINHISPDTTLQFQSLEDDVWVYFQYFTDLNGDGIYEWVTNKDGVPHWDVLSKADTLDPFEKISAWHAMDQDQIRTLTASSLYAYGIDELLNRSKGGDHELDGLSLLTSDNTIFCVSFSKQNYHQEHTEEGDFDSNELLTYYLKIDPVGWADPWVTGANTFTDVDPWDWFYTGVDYAVRNKFFSGVTTSTFAPFSTLTRAMALQTLYGFDGKPLVVATDFGDVDRQTWYYSASCWGVNNGIVSLDSNKNLNPDKPITRQELVHFLYNFAKKEGASLSVNSSLEGFADAGSVSIDHSTAMTWAVERGLVKGDPQGNLNPTGTATRCEASLILMLFMEEVLLPARGES